MLAPPPTIVICDNLFLLIKAGDLCVKVLLLWCAACVCGGAPRLCREFMYDWCVFLEAIDDDLFSVLFLASWLINTSIIPLCVYVELPFVTPRSLYLRLSSPIRFSGRECCWRDLMKPL